jgi:hypothetical protein
MGRFLKSCPPVLIYCAAAWFLQCDILPGRYVQCAWLLKHFVHAEGRFAANLRSSLWLDGASY